MSEWTPASPPPEATNRAMRGAYNKGREARKDGLARDLCPYPDYRGGRHGNIVTWSRAFQSYWYWGWDAVDIELREALESSQGD